MKPLDGKPGVKLWEFPVYVLVTLALLLIGAVLWFAGLMTRLLGLSRGKKDLCGK